MSPAATYWLLDDVSGWQASLAGLSVTGEGRDLCVDALPGLALALPGSLNGVVSCPLAMCESPCGDLCYVLDDLDSSVHILPLKGSHTPRVLHSVGGKGWSPRQLLHPHGVAVLRDGSLAIADTGNRRVKIFSAATWQLTTVLGDGLHSPWGIASGPCDSLYVADRGGRCVLKMDRSGKQLQRLEGFAAPTAIALAPDDKLAVVDGERLVVYAPDRQQKFQQTIAKLSGVTFDSDGFLYAASREGLVYKFAPNATALMREMGVGVLGREGGVDAICWTRSAGLLAVVSVSCLRPEIFRISTGGSYADAGTALLNGLDSDIEQCAWDRIELDCTIPAGTSIVVETQTSTDGTWPNVAFSAPIVLSVTDRICLVQSDPGRYFRMRLTFRTNGVSSPRLHLARIFYPRQSYLGYLPAVYQEDSESAAFLDRFLSIFQADFDAYDNFADTAWKMFDPNTVPTKWFNWLASWLALPIEPSWTEAARRSILKNASQAYHRRGTPDGLTQAIADYSGVQASVVEHYKLRRLTILSGEPDSEKSNASTSAQNRLGSGLRLWSRDVYRRLQVGVYSQLGYFRLTSEPEPQLEPLAWGANEFTVMFAADPYTVATTQAAVTKVVEREKPAHTSAHYQPIYSRLRVGVQSSVGIDTRLGEATYIVLSKVGTLGYDSMLSASSAVKTLQNAGHATPTQTGINTRLS